MHEFSGVSDCSPQYVVDSTALGLHPRRYSQPPRVAAHNALELRQALTYAYTCTEILSSIYNYR